MLLSSSNSLSLPFLVISSGRSLLELANTESKQEVIEQYSSFQSTGRVCRTFRLESLCQLLTQTLLKATNAAGSLYQIIDHSEKH